MGEAISPFLGCDMESFKFILSIFFDLFTRFIEVEILQVPLMFLLVVSPFFFLYLFLWRRN